MERPDRPLPLQAPLLGSAAALAVVALSLWMVLGSSGERTPSQVEQTKEVAAEEERGSIDPSLLAAPEVTERTERVEVPRAVPDVDDPEVAAAAAQDDVTCAVAGVVLLPRTFPSGPAATVRAWRVDEQESKPPAETDASNGRSWQFEALAPGTWVFAARAGAGERIAYGRSRPVLLVEGVVPDLVRIELIEYAVEGRITDSNGLPVPGLDIRYEWDGSDEYAGDPAEISELTSNALFSGNAVLRFNSGEISFSGDTIRLDAPDGLPSGDARGLGELGYGPTLVDVAPVQVASIEVEEIERTLQETRRLYEAAVTVAADELQVNALEWDTPQVTEETPTVFWIGGSSRSGRVTTDADGRYRIALEGPGRIQVVAPAEEGTAAPGGGRWIQQRDYVESTPEATIVEQNFRLVRAASVSGSVRRSDGDEEDAIETFLRRIGSRSTDNTTAREGGFEFEDCEPGEYLFYARSGGQSGQAYSAHRRFVLREGEQFRLDEVLTPSSTATGLVVDPAGAAVVGARVVAYGVDNRSLERRGTTDDSGRFTISGMYGCEYSFEVAGLDHDRPDVDAIPVRADGDRREIRGLAARDLERVLASVHPGDREAPGVVGRAAAL
ncbi:MAG: carboxypeptidase regulatory-like domain-containing protein, partial [Planctomycetota bacterium]